MDQPLSNERADPGERLRRCRAAILDDWSRRVRANVASAEHLATVVLVDDAPNILEHLAKTLSPAYDDDAETKASSVAHIHADHRAELHVYDPDQLVHEYQIMHEIVREHLSEELEADPRTRGLVQTYFDAAIREAVATFAETQSELRDHLNTTMAQGLRNTLGVVRMAAELAMDEADDARATRSLLARIRASSLRADRIVQDVLDLFALRAGRRLRLDLNQWDMLSLVKAVTAEQTEQTGDRFKVTGRSVLGWWAETALKRALETLLENAVRLGDAGAPTVVSVHEAETRVMVSVHNTGHPSDVVSPFDQVASDARTRRLAQGRLLSDSITLARGVAESHGGRLIIQEIPGETPTYTLELPRDGRPFQS